MGCAMRGMFSKRVIAISRSESFETDPISPPKVVPIKDSVRGTKYDRENRKKDERSVNFHMVRAEEILN